MDKQTSLAILNKVREKRSSVGDDFASAVTEANAQRLKDIALSNVNRIALASLGIGAAARGGVGLYNQLRRAVSPPKVTANSAAMTLPYPVEGEEEEAREKTASLGLMGAVIGALQDRGTPHQGTGIGRGMVRGALTDLGAMTGANLGAGLGVVIAGRHGNNSVAVPVSALLGAGLGGTAGYLGSGALLGKHPRELEEEDKEKRKRPGAAVVNKTANFLLGDHAETIQGVPWYAPASALAAIGGGTLGWKGIDAVLANRREKERQDELSAARQEFHDVLIGQYDKPVKSAPKQAADAATASIAASLDSLFTTWQEKTAGARWRTPEGIQAIMRRFDAPALRSAYKLQAPPTHDAVRAGLGGNLANGLSPERARRYALNAIRNRLGGKSTPAYPEQYQQDFNTRFLAPNKRDSLRNRDAIANMARDRRAGREHLHLDPGIIRTAMQRQQVPYYTKLNTRDSMAALKDLNSDIAHLRQSGQFVPNDMLRNRQNVLDEIRAVYQRNVADATSGIGHQKLSSDTVKQASIADLAGQLAGGYGVYAGLTGLGAGALVYSGAKKRQRRAVLEKAMKRRERRRFNTAPSEIVAIPEPVTHQPDVDIPVPKLGVDYFIGRSR